MKPTEYQERLYSIFYNLKHKINDSRTPSTIRILGSSEDLFLEPVTVDDEASLESIFLLSEWRDRNAIWFPAQFQVTNERTKKWIREQLLDKADRILFWIKNGKSEKCGHIGLYRVNPEDYSCEIDNVMRGRDDIAKGMMYYATRVLMEWSFSVLGNHALELTVFADNERALDLYERCGFEVIKRIPLKKVTDSDGVKWEELPKDSENAERYDLKMRVLQS